MFSDTFWLVVGAVVVVSFPVAYAFIKKQLTSIEAKVDAVVTQVKATVVAKI